MLSAETRKGHRVLVVEDDEAVAGIVDEVLRGEGFEVEHVRSGYEGVHRCRSARVDLVLLDHELPDVSGSTVCEQIRSFSDVYIVMLTGRSSEDDKVHALEAGVDDYITKPFSGRELAARLRGMLRRPRAIGIDRREPDPPMGDEALQIDPARRVVTANGKQVELTRIEFDLLASVFRRKGGVVTRADLLGEVWSVDQDSGHVVEVHMSNLRKKLRAAGVDRPSLVTVRGLGYRLESHQHA